MTYKVIHFILQKPFNNAGGVSVYMSNDLDWNITDRYNISLQTCESIWLNVKTKNTVIISLELFVETLDYLTQSISLNN